MRKLLKGFITTLFILLMFLIIDKPSFAKADSIYDVNWDVLTTKQKKLFKKKIDKIVKKKGAENVQTIKNEIKFRAAYIDQDDIPEIIYFDEYGAYDVVSGILYYNGKTVKNISISERESIFYIPRSGLMMIQFNYFNRHEGEWISSEIYKLPSGKKILTGIEDRFFDDDSSTSIYTINSKTVSQKKYEKKMNSVFDLSKSKQALWWCTYGGYADDEVYGSAGYYQMMYYLN